jgi:hypothetical protein
MLSGLVLLSQIAGLTHGFWLDDSSWFEALFRALPSPLRIISPWRQGEFRPLAQVLFFLEYEIFGTNPVGFNAVSLLLHLGCSVLVGRLAFLGGMSRNQSWAAGLAFCGGLGHYTKPITWACAQGLEMGTLFVLWAADRLWLRKLRGAGGGIPVLPILFFVFALLSHEILVLACLGLAWQAGRERERRWWLCGLLVCLIALGYGLATLQIHERHFVAQGSVATAFWTFFHFPATYFLPPQLLATLPFLLPRAAALRSLQPLLNATGYVVGAAVWAGIVVLARRRAGPPRWLMVYALLLFLPVLALPMPSWIEPRDLYAVTAFLAPAVISGLWDLGQRLSLSGRRFLAVGLVLWGAGIASGSIYMQKHASDMAREPSCVRRWEHVKGLAPSHRTRQP